jgi:hypothetical protein
LASGLSAIGPKNPAAKPVQPSAMVQTRIPSRTSAVFDVAPIAARLHRKAVRLA